MSTTLIIILILLVLVNIYLATEQFSKHMSNGDTPIMQSIKDISVVYEILDELATESKAYKVAISKACYKCETPYAEMIYDNSVDGEQRYNEKYNRLAIDQAVVDELKLVANGDVIAVHVKDLPDGLKKELYSAEGIVYSETHKVFEIDERLYVMVLHYRMTKDEIGADESVLSENYLNKLVEVFERNKSWV